MGDCSAAFFGGPKRNTDVEGALADPVLPDAELADLARNTRMCERFLVVLVAPRAIFLVELGGCQARSLGCRNDPLSLKKRCTSLSGTSGFMPASSVLVLFSQALGNASGSLLSDLRSPADLSAMPK